MTRRLVALAAAAFLALSPFHSAGAQTPAADPFAAARAQLQSRHYDTATALLQAILADSTVSAGNHAAAWMWLALVRYYAGDDSGTARAFRAAVALDPKIDASGLDRIDPELAAMFAAARVATPFCSDETPCARVTVEAPLPSDGIHSCVPRCERGLRRPVLVRFPPRIDPTIPGSALMAPGGGPGVVIVQGTVSPLGQVEQGSVRVVSATTLATERIVEEMLRDAEFRPGTLEGRPVRVTVQLRYECRREGTGARCYFR